MANVEEYARVTRDVFGRPRVHLPIRLLESLSGGYSLVFDSEFVTEDSVALLRELHELRAALAAHPTDETGTD